MATKMSRRLLGLSSSAVAAIYMAGYLATSGADARVPELEPTVAAPPPTFVVPTATMAPSATATPIVVASAATAAPPTRTAPPTRVPTSTPTAAPTRAASGTYRDGVYAGAGNSRRGGFEVAVTVTAGRIVDVALTRVTTQYPASRISRLPGQVVERQSAAVDRVTGATYSVQAFQQAVQQALAQAKA